VKLNISTRIFCAVFAVSFLFMAGWGLVSYQLEKTDISHSLRTRITLTTSRLCHSLTSPLWNLDDSEIGRIIDSEALDENIRAIVLRTDEGRFIAGQIKTRGSATVFATPDHEQDLHLLGRRYLSASETITKDSTPLGVVTVYAEDAPLRLKLERRLIQFVAVAFLLCFGLSATLYLVLRRTIVTPLRKVEESVARISIDNLMIPIPVSGDDEIGRLASRFKQMTLELQSSLDQQQQTNEQLLQAQKMEVVGLLVGGISHDFNNILGAIIGSAEMLRLLMKREQLEQPAKIEKHISTICDSGTRAAELIRQLLILSMKQEVNLARIDLREVVTHVGKLLQSSQDKSIELRVELPDESAMVNADMVQMEQVLLNLCINACHAMTIMREEGATWGGELRISLARVDTKTCSQPLASTPDIGFCWRLSVMDAGVGMDAATLQHIFTPFFTTKQQGIGSGLGLSMVYSILKQQNGNLAIDSTPGQGSTFHILLPAAQLPASGSLELPAESNNSLPINSGLILLVDDEISLQENCEQILTNCGFKVLIAGNGAEGIDLARQRGTEIRLIILDMNMPVMSGLDALDQIKAAAPGAKVLLTSGFKQDPRVLELLTKDLVDGFIHKPFALHQLAWNVHMLLQDAETL